jgi:hypothetical protein
MKHFRPRRFFCDGCGAEVFDFRHATRRLCLECETLAAWSALPDLHAAFGPAPPPFPPPPASLVSTDRR